MTDDASTEQGSEREITTLDRVRELNRKARENYLHSIDRLTRSAVELVLGFEINAAGGFVATPAIAEIGYHIFSVAGLLPDLASHPSTTPQETVLRLAAGTAIMGVGIPLLHRAKDNLKKAITFAAGGIKLHEQARDISSSQT